MSVARHSGVALALLLSATGCPADRIYPVTLYNQTERHITIELVGTTDGPPRIRELEPGSSTVTDWLRPTGSSDPHRATVRARDENGVEIYCRRLSFDQVRGNFSWRVDITTGVSECD
jgi:hypothetical protein